MAQVLLERDEVNLNKRDNYGRTPLCYAALHGHTAVVKLLLGHDVVNPGKPHTLGRTPL